MADPLDQLRAAHTVLGVQGIVISKDPERSGSYTKQRVCRKCMKPWPCAVALVLDRVVAAERVATAATEWHAAGLALEEYDGTGLSEDELRRRFNAAVSRLSEALAVWRSRTTGGEAT